MRLTQRAIVIAAASTFVLSGCFLDSDSDSPAPAASPTTPATPTTPTTPTATKTLTGTAMAGPLSNGQVCAYTLDSNGVVGAVALKCGSTDSNGTYTLSWADYAGNVLVKAWGSYLDEATNVTKTITEANALRSTAACTRDICDAAITPLTEAALRSAADLTSAKLAAAYLRVAQAFGVNVSTTDEALEQLVTRIPSLTGTDLGARTYAQLLAVVSQDQRHYCGNDATCGLNDYLTSRKDQLANDAGVAEIRSAINEALQLWNANPLNTTGMTCTYSGNTLTCDLKNNGSSTPNNGSGNYKLNIVVNANGIATPAIVLNNIDKPSNQDDFCGSVQVQSTAEQIKQGNPGSTWTLNSCSFNGTTGTISATIGMTSPVVMSIPYTINYSYSSM